MKIRNLLSESISYSSPPTGSPHAQSLIAALIAAVPIAASAQVQTRDTTVSVNISRTGRAPADRASLYLGVEAVAETIPLAIQRLQEKLKAVLDSVKRASPSTQADVPVVMSAGPSAPSGYPQPTSPVMVARGAVRSF